MGGFSNQPSQSFIAVQLVFRPCRKAIDLVCLWQIKLPTHFAQRHGLADEPRLRAVAILLRTPMLRLGHALAVQFKNQFRMPGLENIGVHILMARDANVGADVKILQVAHPGGGSVGAGVIGPRVGTQPVLRRPVTTFAGNAFAGFEVLAAQIFRHAIQRRVADGAARIGGCVLDVQSVGDLLRARGGERGRRTLRMEILERPDEKLVLVRAAAAVATGAGAGIRAEKLCRRVRAPRRAGRQNNGGDTVSKRKTNCFTHNVKLVNGVAA